MSNVFTLSAPKGWKTVPMWTIATRKDRKGFPEAELLSVYREYGVIRKSDRDDNHNVESEDLSGYKFVKKGDLVLNKMKTWQGSLGVSPYDGIVSPAYFTCELSSNVFGSFIHYLLRSQPYIAMYAAASKGIRVGQWDLPYEEFREMPVLLPPMEVQQRIAAFLEAKIEVIDNVSLKISLLLSKNSEYLQAQISDQFRENKLDKVPLRYLCRNVNAKFTGSLPTLSLDLVNVRKGTLITEELPITHGDTATAMKEGDVAFGKLRPYLGKVFLASSEIFAESEFIVLRSDPNKLMGGYLRDFLLSSDTLQSLESKSIGAKMPRTSWDDLADLQIPLPSLENQKITMAKIEELRTQAASLDHLGKLMLSSLSDLKSSIITSAVTGQVGVMSQGSIE